MSTPNGSLSNRTGQKPVILLVDDEPAVLAAVARDLQPHYGDRFRTLRADSGAAALETLRRLKLRETPVALLLVDQRMPGMTGVEFLTEAIKLYPDVKRVLLTAYADTEAAIRAINEVELDHYLMKPWDPPEENLYPVLDDALYDWLAVYAPPFEGIRIIGTRWSADTFQTKDFLARNLIPYRSLDVERDAEASELLELAGVEPRELPVLIFPDGSTLVRPSTSELASRIGLETAASLPSYDVVIVGAGPSGLAAAVYGSSEGLRTLVIEKQAPGGQAGTSSKIENYLGFPAGLSGADLARRGTTQAKRLGAEFLTGEVVGIRTDGQYRIVQLADGCEISTQALILATGVDYNKLRAPGIEKYEGAGVYYGGALSEAIATRGEDVFIVGGANSAGQAAIHFANYANCVRMLVRGSSLPGSGMSQYLVDRIDETPNIEVWLNSSVVEAHGNDHLESLRIANSQTGSEQIVPASSVFIFIGAKPVTHWLDGQLAQDPQGYLLTGPDLDRDPANPLRWPLKREPFVLETNIPGTFVAGDLRHRSRKRIASATGEGAMAIHFVHQYLSTL
ncbi:FAD-dependent oxidoreductase [soil metagenome]